MKDDERTEFLLLEYTGWTWLEYTKPFHNATLDPYISPLLFMANSWVQKDAD